MKGKYEIEIHSKAVAYKFEIRRNITIIRGDSGTGKTQLIRLIQEHALNGSATGVMIRCDVPCLPAVIQDWEEAYSRAHDRIYFLDENTPYIRSEAFAEVVQKADCYFVIITREELHMLPYSITEILGIRIARDTQKYAAVSRLYNEFYQIYPNQGTMCTLCTRVV